MAPAERLRRNVVTCGNLRFLSFEGWTRWAQVEWLIEVSPPTSPRRNRQTGHIDARQRDEAVWAE